MRLPMPPKLDFSIVAKFSASSFDTIEKHSVVKT